MHRVDYLLEYLKDQMDISQITFVLLNDCNSYDQDVYIVTKQNISFFKLWKFNGIWYEVFVDSEQVLHNKLANRDEIIINFLNQFTFYYGNSEKYYFMYSLAKDAKNQYSMSLNKKRKIQYRIKVLSSKVTGDSLNDAFIISSMVYPIAQLLLEKSGVMQCSPKQWTKIIQTKCDSYYCNLFIKMLRQQILVDELQVLIDYLCDDFDGIAIAYDAGNDSTFVC